VRFPQQADQVLQRSAQRSTDQARRHVELPVRESLDVALGQ
jgi:hypothetical protein